ncbi:MAG: hypothetical protein IPF93_13410 [Saprospiraceae bacterium]|nr:hypothetical protein [Saprospiraceae bacterium]
MKVYSYRGASGHNLQSVSVVYRLGTFICVTGVSGSGKSSLINETLYPILRKYFGSLQKPLAYKKLTGIDEVNKVIEIDQSPIGRTYRSNPATYTGVFTGDIRNIFTGLPESMIRGYKAGWFSFNVKGGRCETCEGLGACGSSR